MQKDRCQVLILEFGRFQFLRAERELIFQDLTLLCLKN
jgi:hypothetical protein